MNVTQALVIVDLQDKTRGVPGVNTPTLKLVQAKE
jgi:hypothetical protein